jgi:hypothetical protein
MATVIAQWYLVCPEYGQHDADISVRAVCMPGKSGQACFVPHWNELANTYSSQSQSNRNCIDSARPSSPQPISFTNSDISLSSLWPLWVFPILVLEFSAFISDWITSYQSLYARLLPPVMYLPVIISQIYPITCKLPSSSSVRLANPQ